MIITIYLAFFIGMSAFEVMLAHVFTQLFVMIVQVGLLLVFILAVFHVSTICNYIHHWNAVKLSKNGVKN